MTAYLGLHQWEAVVSSWMWDLVPGTRKVGYERLNWYSNRNAVLTKKFFFCFI